MSRRWKITISILILIPIVVLTAGSVMIGSQFGWRAASRFLRGAIFGTDARSLTSRTFQPTPERLERGRYLVEGAAGCLYCHTEEDPVTWEPLPDKIGAGKVEDDEEVPFPIVYPNITPDKETGAGTWTDDMLARAIREGIGHDGRPLVPVMLYENYRYMSDEDLASVVVYLRSMTPVRNPLPKMKVRFPFNLAVKAFPEPIETPVPQPGADPVGRGEYLMHLGDCDNCHSARDRDGEQLPFAGGGQFKGPDGKEVAAANITPHPSGISYYDDALFIQAMRTGRVGARELSRAMPWPRLAKLTDDDLKALFAYLRAQKPVAHRVDNAEPPTPCKLCGETHGAGEKN